MNVPRNRTKARAGARPLFDGPRREWLVVGKYQVLSEPLPGATHMRRYSVFFEGRRIGATVSVPSESDCQHLEHPSPVPPLKSFYVAYRPGRPKKGAAPRAAAAISEDKGPSVSHEDLPTGAPTRDYATLEEDG